MEDFERAFNKRFYKGKYQLSSRTASQLLAILDRNHRLGTATVPSEVIKRIVLRSDSITTKIDMLRRWPSLVTPKEVAQSFSSSEIYRIWAFTRRQPGRDQIRTREHKATVRASTLPGVKNLLKVLDVHEA